MKNSTKTALIAFILGLGVMFVADMIFHSNTALLEQLIIERSRGTHM